MHPAPTPKTLTPYSFSDVTEFLQTRMQNARRSEAQRARRENPYSIRLFDERRARPGAEVSARSPMPAQPHKGIDTVFGVKRNFRRKARLTVESRRQGPVVYA
jgi:hypothetical protein